MCCLEAEAYASDRSEWSRGEPHLIVGNTILTKQIRLDLPTTTFFVQINDYWKWEAIFQISIKPQEIVLTFASRNSKFNEGVNKFCTTHSRLANVYHVVGSFSVNWVNSIKPFQQKAWFSILYWFSKYRHLTFLQLLLTYSLAI